MVRAHSSVLLFSACCVLLLILALPWPAVGWACLGTFVAATMYARAGLLRLLRRSRWLLLVSIVLFAWMTPGMPVPWLPGATQDGLQQAFEQTTRLIASIAMVAILLAGLDQSRLVAACYGLLAPLRVLGVDVERWVIRLALTLRGLEGGDAGAANTGGEGQIRIRHETLHAIDYGLLTLLLLLFTLTGIYLL